MTAAKRKTAKARTPKTSAAKTGKAKTRTAKTGARKTGAAKARAAKARPPKWPKAECTPELSLAAFLVNLATDERIRNDFNDNPGATMDEAMLSDAAKAAINAGKQNDLLRLICVSQQNT